MKIALSSAGTQLVRAMAATAGDQRHRVLLGEFNSTDWRSLSFIGERHRLVLLYPTDLLQFLREALDDIQLCGFVLADAAIEKEAPAEDGMTKVSIEALTVEE